MRDLYATKDTYVSTALTRGVNLAWLPTGPRSLLQHFGGTTEGSSTVEAADTFELSKIDSEGSESTQFAPPSAKRSKKLFGLHWWSRRDLNPCASFEKLSKIKDSGFSNVSQYG
jgi:hypothetical protein